MICRLCGSDSKKEILIENGYSLQKCLSCGFISVDSNFSYEEARQTYLNYYEGKNDDEIFDDFHSRNVIFQHINKKVSSLIPGKGRILDVGAGFGNFLDIARKSDWDCFGIEINPKAVNFIINRLKINASSDDLLDFVSKSKFNVITFIDTLEHVNRPLEYIKKACELLDEEGVIYIRVPNIQFHLFKTKLFRLFDKDYKGLELPHHISHFTPNTLEVALVTAGFTNITITPSPQENNHAQIVKKIYQPFAWLMFRFFKTLRFANLIEATAHKKSL